MPDIIIPRGGARDGWIWTSVNGIVQWIKAGEQTTVSTSTTEVLDHANIRYSLPNGVDPLIFADFKNNIYLIQGSAVSLADVVEQNTDFGLFDPANVAGGIGLSDPGNAGTANPCLKQSLASVLTLGAGCTLVVIFQGGGSLTMLDTPSFNNAYTATFAGDDLQVGDGSANFVEDNVLLGTLTKIAANLGMARVAGSLGGRPVIAMDTYNATNPGAAVPFNTAAVSLSNPSIIESVGWYPLQLETDLPTLSDL